MAFMDNGCLHVEYKWTSPYLDEDSSGYINLVDVIDRQSKACHSTILGKRQQNILLRSPWILTSYQGLKP